MSAYLKVWNVWSKAILRFLFKVIEKIKIAESDWKKKGKLKEFVNDTLNKCVYILSIRKESNLHSNNVILPQEVNEYQTYHVECYRRFTAVPQKYKNAAITEPSTSTAK